MVKPTHDWPVRLQENIVYYTEDVVRLDTLIEGDDWMYQFDVNQRRVIHTALYLYRRELRLHLDALNQEAQEIT